MCSPCVWWQIPAISYHLLTPVQHKHQYILGWPPSDSLQNAVVKPKNRVCLYSGVSVSFNIHLFTLVCFFNLALPELLQGKITPKRWFSLKKMLHIAQRMHSCSNLIEQLGTLFSKKIKMRCIPYLWWNKMLLVSLGQQYPWRQQFPIMLE